MASEIDDRPLPGSPAAWRDAAERRDVVMAPFSHRILYVQYTNPAAYPPLEHSARILADMGWEVVLIGLASHLDRLLMPAHERIRVERCEPTPAGWRQKAHYVVFAARVIARARQWRPRWIYASDPLSCPIVLLAAVVAGARVIYHEHDSPEPTERHTLFMKAVLVARHLVARGAQLCVLPNRARADAFGRVAPHARVFTVWNCPMRDEALEVPRRRMEGRMRALYHGSIVPARLPLSVIDALSTLPPTAALVIAGYETAGFPGYVETIRRRAAELGILDRVEFVGTVPQRADLMDLCGTCDVGLALMPMQPCDVNERDMVGASNKPFDYMARGLALLVSELPAWQRTFVDAGCAFACDPASSDSIARALKQLLENPELRWDMGERGRRRIRDDWHYERAFAPVLAVLETGAIGAGGEVANASATASHV